MKEALLLYSVTLAALVAIDIDEGDPEEAHKREDQLLRTLVEAAAAGTDTTEAAKSYIRWNRKSQGRTRWYS